MVVLDAGQYINLIKPVLEFASWLNVSSDVGQQDVNLKSFNAASKSLQKSKLNRLETRTKTD